MRAGDRAYQALREEILSWTLAPGTVLGEVEQSTRLGVSRTPIREALKRLQAEGLVAPQAGRGLVVAPITTADLNEIFQVRDALESRAASIAAKQGDREEFADFVQQFERAGETLALGGRDRSEYYDLVTRFDRAIDDATRNPYLVAALDAIRIHLVRIRRLATENLTRLQAASREHRQIALAISEGNAELAAHATHVHLANALRSALAAAATRDDLLAQGAANEGDTPAETSSIQPKTIAKPNERTSA